MSFGLEIHFDPPVTCPLSAACPVISEAFAGALVYEFNRQFTDDNSAGMTTSDGL